MAKLYFKYGAMGSSKSAQALITKFNYEEKGLKVWLIKPAIDVRDNAYAVVSRIGLSCANTFSITPVALGRSNAERADNLVSILDGYFANKAHHININVLNRATLMKAYEDPEAFPNLTIRVSGYAVNFHKLSREQQREVISRTFHEVL